MEKQSPIGRIWELGEQEHGKLITAVILAVIGVVGGMVPYFAAAKIIVDQVDSMETTLAHLFPEMTANITAPALTLVYLFVLDWRLALLSLAVFPVAFVFMMTVMGGYAKDYEGAVQATNEMSGTMIEYIHGIEVIKAFNQGKQSYISA